MPLNPNHFYQFGPFSLEPAERRLSAAGQPVSLPPKDFDLLLALVEARGRLCTIEDLRNKVWPGSPFMEDQNVSVRISQIRKALDDGGNGGHKYIETVRGPGGGYRFLAEVVERSDNKKPGRPRLVGLVAVCAMVVIGSSVILVQQIMRRGRLTEGQKFYALALDYEKRGDDDQAIAALDRAMSIDPGLADAYLEAACIYLELDEWDKAAPYLEKAKALATTRDQGFKLTVEGLDLETRGYQDDALQRYQLVVDRFPRDTQALYRLADLALEMRRLEDAERAIAACNKAEPDNPYCNLDAMVLSLLRNDFDGVLRQYRSLSAQGVHYPWFHAPVGAAFLGKNDMAGAASEFQILEGVKTRFHGTTHFRAAKERLADLDLYTGRLASARGHMREAMETAISLEERADDLLFPARTEMLVGNDEAAKAAAMEATQVSPSPLVYVSAAGVLVSVGDAEVLKSVLAERTPSGVDLGDIGPANLNFIKGAFALQRGRLDEAVSMLGRSYEEDDDVFSAFLLARAHERARHWERAIDLYSRVLAAKGDVLWNDISALLPLAQYHSADCYRKLNRIEAARTNYVSFLELWSNADQQIGEVSAARKSLAALQGPKPTARP